MAVNLRLRDDAAAALRAAESERTGLSQQEILRQAVDEHLGLASAKRSAPYPDWVIPPERPYRPVTPTIIPPPGRTMTQILDELRDDRV